MNAVWLGHISLCLFLDSELLITESGCFLEKKKGADVVDWTEEHQGVNGKIIKRASRTTIGQFETL